MRLVVEKIEDEAIDGRLPEVLSVLPEWRRQKALSYRFARDQYACGRAFLMLQEMLGQEFGLQKVPEFSYGEYGKPFFKEYPGIHFSISHCGSAIACAVSDAPVGVDVEEYSFDPQVAEAALSASELSEVRNSECPGRTFAKFWTAKEALLKLRGCGIDGDMRGLLEEAGKKVDFQYVDCPENGYITTVASCRGLANPLSP